jgi:hypothetical protein
VLRWQGSSILRFEMMTGMMFKMLRIVVFWTANALGGAASVFFLTALTRRLIGFPTELGGVLVVSLIVFAISLLLYVPTFDVCKSRAVHSIYWALFLLLVLAYVIWGK